jgi:hypothetical protein
MIWGLFFTMQNKLPQATFQRLCQIERNLHKWAEDECNGFIQWDDEDCTIPRRYRPNEFGCPVKGPVIANREARYLKEAQTLAAECGGKIYHQGDPRGCSLYFYRESDLEGYNFPIDQVYNVAALACC